MAIYVNTNLNIFTFLFSIIEVQEIVILRTTEFYEYQITFYKP